MSNTMGDGDPRSGHGRRHRPGHPSLRRHGECGLRAADRRARRCPSPEMREVAEQVRAPWRTGGPVMQQHDRARRADRGRVRCGCASTIRACTQPAPALVYMHGGGWTLFSLDTHDRVMREYAARAGVVVVGVDYALSPEARFPVALAAGRRRGALAARTRRDVRRRRRPHCAGWRFGRAAISRSARRSRCGTPGRATTSRACC